MAVFYSYSSHAQQLLERYQALLSERDHFNSSGQRLTSAAAIIRQDRANFHRYGLRDQADESDSYFFDADNRAALERLLERGRAEPGVISRIVNGTPLVRVEVWRGNAGPFVTVTLIERQEVYAPSSTSPLEQATKPDETKAGTPTTRGASITIPMQREGGTYTVPVLINNAITLDFVIDSGASDVSVPADVVSTLFRTGTIKESDFIGTQTYVLADGSKVPSMQFRLRSLKVGDKILGDVIASVAPAQGSLLLGQSFLSRFQSWSIDNASHSLLLID
jgi:predicted aspartyl protease